MKANELRIGNYVKQSETGVSTCHCPGDVFEWSLSDFYEVECSQLLMDTIEPIPLTEEWLLKFGFTGDYLFHDIEYFSLSKTNTGGNYYCVYFENEYTAVYIEYVHQLQNLYFALTGTELELTDKPKLSLK